MQTPARGPLLPPLAALTLPLLQAATRSGASLQENICVTAV